MEAFDVDELLVRIKKEFFDNGENFKDTIERMAFEEEFNRSVREFYYKYRISND
jgi:hypothetical protein